MFDFLQAALFGCCLTCHFSDAKSSDEKVLSDPSVIFDAKKKVSRMAISADGEYVAFGNYSSVFVYNMRKKEENQFTVQRTSGLDFAAKTGILGVVTIEIPKLLEPDTAQVILWDTKESRILRRIPIWDDGDRIEPVFTGKFSDDGKLFAMGSYSGTGIGGLITLYDLEKKDIVGQTKISSGGVVSICFSKHAKFVYAGTAIEEKKRGNVIIWNRSTDEKIVRAGHQGSVYSIAAAPQHRMIISGGGSTLHEVSDLLVWEQETGKLLQQFDKVQSCISRVSTSPDGRFLATGDIVGKVLIWELPAMKKIADVQPSKTEVKLISFTGDRMLVGTEDGKLTSYRLLAKGK